MVALRTERRVFLWRVWPQPSPVEANKDVTLDEYISVLEGAHSAKMARVFLHGGGRILEDDDPRRDDKNQLYIAEIKRDEKRKAITLLVNRGDPDAVSPAFLNPTANAVRVEHPKGAEAPGWSAHLVIAADPEEGGAHRATFEQMPHVSSQLVLDALDKIIARSLAGNPTYRYDVDTHKGGKAKIVWKPYRPALNANRVPSERLVDDLKIGELSGLTLSRRKWEYGGVGPDSIVKREEQRVVIGLKRVGEAAVESFLAKLLPQARTDGFEAVTFHIDKLPGRQTNNPTLRLADQDAMEQLYVRAKRLVFDEIVLEQCYSVSCPEIEDKMISILADDENW